METSDITTTVKDDMQTIQPTDLVNLSFYDNKIYIFINSKVVDSDTSP